MFFLLLVLIIILPSCKSNDNCNQNLKYYCSKENDITGIIELYNKYCLKNYNESYQIDIVQFDSSEEMITKLSTEIMAGGGPDIISLDQSLPFEKLIDNEAFADINELIRTYNYDFNFSNCNLKVMESGIFNKKRYVIPLFYCPDILISTQEIFEKYDLNILNFKCEDLSGNMIHYNKRYSLFGSEDYNEKLFYSFVNEYVDFNNKTVNFESDEFSRKLNLINGILENDSTIDNIYYDLTEADCLFCTPQSMSGGSITSMMRGYCSLYSQGKKPILISNFNSNDNSIKAYIQCGIAINENSTQKEKSLVFMEYILSEEVQEYWCGGSGKSYLGSNTLALPVNNQAFNNAIDTVSKDIYDFNGDGEYDDNEIAKFNQILDVFLEEYVNKIDNINEYDLYNYEGIKNTYYNSYVIGDIIENYLDNKISVDKFIRQLTATTKIYLTE